MQKSIFSVLLTSILLLTISCRQEQHDVPSVQTLADTGNDASSPYLTQDQNGNAVLCWTERSQTDSLYRLKYARYDTQNKRFGNAVTVIPSAGTKPSAESMNKVAFKADGSIIAVFTRKFENQENRFAGAILYSASTDQGKSWTAAKYLHSDTSHAYGRNYFDLSRMKNGEIGAIWLDGRFGKSDPGSALFFAGTSKANVFENEKCIDRNTCECCRTDLLVSENGKLNIAYRSIMFPPKLLGKQVRDMAYTYSEDNGRTFGKVNTISHDNWAIEGCPHTGPSLASNAKGLYALWFTAGNNPGVYLGERTEAGQNFSPRKLQSENARHPQLIARDDDSLLMLWEENTASAAPSTEKESHHNMNMSHQQEASFTKIVLTVINGGEEQRKIELTDGSHADHHAVLSTLDHGALVAWVTEDNDKSVIRYSFVDIRD